MILCFADDMKKVTGQIVTSVTQFGNAWKVSDGVGQVGVVTLVNYLHISPDHLKNVALRKVFRTVKIN